jgi:hypothetical protein
MPRRPEPSDHHQPEVDESAARTGPDDEHDQDDVYGEPDVRTDTVEEPEE